ncbi:MAG: glycosyltransferase [Patescibacteria group bacterium]
MNYTGKQSKTEVSVIMAVYNGMPFLKQAVKSILNQTFKNFEFIIVDDGSSDGTCEYLKKINNNRLKIIKNKKNFGLATSLNKAFKVSIGKYVARMDADDISLPKRLELQYYFMKNKPEVDICGTWVAIIDENGRKIGKVHYPVGDKDIKKTLRKVTPLIHPTWFLRRSVFNELKGYKPVWDIVEDYDFLLRAKNFKMANIPKELVYWRTQKNRRSTKDIQKMYKKSLMLRLEYFKQGKLDISYLPYVVRSVITTYIIPPKLKIYLNQKAHLI